MNLVEERHAWRTEIEAGTFQEPYELQMYRTQRESHYWRSSRIVERLCEYIIYLEKLVEENVNEKNLISQFQKLMDETE